MSQKVKCPRCKNIFSIEDAHEQEIKNLKERAKKEALVEAQVEKAKADKEIKTTKIRFRKKGKKGKRGSSRRNEEEGHSSSKRCCKNEKKSRTGCNGR